MRQSLRFSRPYGRLPLADAATGRYVFNVPDPSNHGHWMSKGGGSGGAGATEGEHAGGAGAGGGGGKGVSRQRAAMRAKIAANGGGHELAKQGDGGGARRQADLRDANAAFPGAPRGAGKAARGATADAMAAAGKGKAEANGTGGAKGGETAGLHQKASEWQAAQERAGVPHEQVREAQPGEPLKAVGHVNPRNLGPDHPVNPHDIVTIYGERQFGNAMHGYPAATLRKSAAVAGIDIKGAGNSKATLVSLITAHVTGGHYSANFGGAAKTGARAKAGGEDAFHASYKAKMDTLRGKYQADAAKKGYTPRQLSERQPLRFHGTYGRLARMS